jgi:hypothetical protein
VVDTNGLAADQSRLLLYQATLVWVWCTYTTKPISAFLEKLGQHKSNRQQPQRRLPGGKRGQHQPSNPNRSYAADQQAVSGKTARRVGVGCADGKYMRFHQISSTYYSQGAQPLR